MLSLVFTVAACRDTPLYGGDISAAFLQGSKLDRTLILSQPKGGIPGQPSDLLYRVSSTVYGTKDAPRGWFKNLDASSKEEGPTPIPFENASYSLIAKDGSLSGLVAVHVHDLIWTGGEDIEKVMKKVCDTYKFGKLGWTTSDTVEETFDVINMGYTSLVIP